jgi:hypothetical protein
MRVRVIAREGSLREIALVERGGVVIRLTAGRH